MELVNESELEYDLVAGWTNILLFGQTTVKEPTEYVTQINSQDFQVLFFKLADYMYREVNWGGHPGCQMSSEKQVKKLKVTHKLLSILVTAEQKHKGLVEHLVKQEDKVDDL